MLRSAIAVLLLYLVAAGRASAVDYPVGGNFIRINDPGDPDRRQFFFRTVKQANISLATIQDPTVAGATLEVVGTGGGDGGTGIIPLPAENWEPLNNGGYYYRDHAAANGVSQVRIKPRSSVGGSIHIGGRNSGWGYLVTQPQTGIKLRLTIGTAVYCAHFTDLQPNRAGMALGKKNAAPGDCS